MAGNAYDFSGPFVSAAITPDPKNPVARFPLWSLQGTKVEGFSALNGLKALSFLTEVSVKQHLGLVPTITAQLNPPFEDARRLLDSSIIEWGKAILEVTIGYSSGVPNGTQLAHFDGIILKPDISLGIDTSITLNAQGVGGFAAATTTRTKTWSKTDPMTVLRDIFGDTLKVDISKLDDKDAKKLLNTKLPSISQSGLTNWYFAQTLVKDAGCWGFEVGRTFQIVSRNSSHGSIPKWKFRLFDLPGTIGGGSDGVYPILSFSTPTMAVFLAGAAKALRALGTDRKTMKKVELVANDAKADIKRSGNKGQGYKDQQPKPEEAEMLPIEAANTRAKSILENEYKNAANGMGITIDVETLGMPDLLPGHLIEVQGVSNNLDGQYVVMSLEHSIGSGGFSTKFRGVTNSARFSAKEKEEITPKQPNKEKINEKNPESKLGPKGGTQTVSSVEVK